MGGASFTTVPAEEMPVFVVCVPLALANSGRGRYRLPPCLVPASFGRFLLSVDSLNVVGRLIARHSFLWVS